MRELRPVLPESRVVKEFRDLDGDGVSELLVLVADFVFLAYHCHACFPGYKRVFAWDQETSQYVDRSNAFPDFYAQEIDELRGQLAVEDIPEYISGYACSLMLIMGALGWAEEAIPEFEGYMAKVALIYPPEAVADVTKTIIAAAREDSRWVRDCMGGQDCSL